MKHTATLLVALALVVGSFAVVPATASQPGANAHASVNADARVSPNATVTATNAAATAPTVTARTDDSSDGSADEDIPPGARLSGVVSVQRAEIDGDVESRAFGLKIAKARTAGAKAGIVADQVAESQRRVEALEKRLDELERARENGSLSRGQYAARTAEVQAELDNVRRMTDRTAAVSAGLPREVLEANGVNVTAIETLRRNASNMTGPEVAAVARQIAGPNSARPGERPRGLDAVDRTAPGKRVGGNRTAAGPGGGVPTVETATTASGNVSVSSGDSLVGDDT